MPKSQLLFSPVFGFRNPTKEIFSEFDEINAQDLIFPRSFQRAREGPEGSPGGPPHMAARPGGAPADGGPPPGSSEAALPPIKSLRLENPKNISHGTKKVTQPP